MKGNNCLCGKEAEVECKRPSCQQAKHRGKFCRKCWDSHAGAMPTHEMREIKLARAG